MDSRFGRCFNNFGDCKKDLARIVAAHHKNVSFCVHKGVNSDIERTQLVITVAKGEFHMTLKADARAGLQNADVPWASAVDNDVKRLLEILSSLADNFSATMSDQSGGYIQGLHQDVTEVTKISDETWHKIRGVKFRLSDMMVDTCSANFLLHKPLLRLLSTIRGLVLLNLSMGHWQDRHGMCLLDAAVERDGSRLKVLNITNLFKAGINMHNNQRVIGLIGSLKQLTTLSLSYNCLGEPMLEQLACRQGEILRFLGVTVSEGYANHHSVSAESWQMLATKCPRAKVAVAFEGVTDVNVVKTILVPTIPLMYLEVGGALRTRWERFHTVILLEHLKDNFAHNLEEAVLHIRPHPRDNIDETLVKWMRASLRLHTLSMVTKIKMTSVRIIVSMGLSEELALKSIKMRLLGCTRQEKDVLRKLMDKYRTELNSRNLQYKFSTDSNLGNEENAPLPQNNHTPRATGSAVNEDNMP